MVYKELLLCAHAECLKWVPSLADGLKPKQRIILQATFLISKVTPIASLIGLILQTISNEYSETTLQSSIISACQNYIGSNNFNILLPKGHFGTRLLEGKDCAPVHQLSVEPNPLLTYLFKS